MRAAADERGSIRDSMTIERHAITDHAEWLQRRRKDVTASTIGALFAVHPYCTALRLYAEKRGVEFVNDENMAMRRGRWLEPAVAKAVGDKRPEWALEVPKVYLREPAFRIGATPDFYINGDPRGLGVLQAKTVAPSVFHSQWDEGREVPLWITLQCLTEMMLSDAAFGAVAVLLVDPHQMDCYIHEIPRNQQAEGKIVRAVEEFWRMVETGQEPEPDYGRDAEVIKAMLPQETAGKQFDASGHNELPALLDQRAHLMERIKADDARKEAIETEIKFLMQDAEIIAGLPGWRITFKSTDRAGFTVPPKTIRSLRITDKRKPEEVA